MKKYFLSFIFAIFLGSVSTFAMAQERNLEQEQANQQLVLNFYEQFFNQKKLEVANQFIGDTYIQHHPNVPNGREALIAFAKPLFAQYPNIENKILQVATNGDLVWLHIHSKLNPQDKGLMIVDIFRVENNKIVEHWDVIQAVE